MKKTIIISAIGLMTLVAACSKSYSSDNSNNSYIPDCSGAAKSYLMDVSPIIQAYCSGSGCHASGSINGPGALTNYQQVFDARASIRAAIISGIMPEGASLSVTQKNNIICWIDNGATNN